MEVRQLNHFLTVADEGHFTRAAARLHMSQSALSASIRALENELAIALFERTTRRVVLTVAGDALRDHAQAVVREMAAASDAVAGVRDLTRGVVNVGTVQTFTAVDLPRLLAETYVDNPGWKIGLREATTTELVAAVGAGDLDLAFVAIDRKPLDPAVRILRTYVEPLTAAVGTGHALASRRSVSVARLATYPFIDFEAGPGLQTVVATLFESAEIERDIAFRVSDMDRLLQLVRRGLGVAVVPEAVLADVDGVVGVALTAKRAPTREVALITSATGPSNPAARVLLERVTAS